MYPQLEIHLDRIRQNLDAVCRITKEEGHCKTLAIVTKGVCADPEIVKIIISEPRVDYIADSRVKNIASYADLAHEKGRKTMLLRIPMPSELIEVVRYVDLCQISELQTIRLLNREAEKAGKKQDILLMIDMGDLREGMFFQDEEAILKTCCEILKMEHVVLEGIGVNLSCYGAIIPKPDNLGGLCAIAEKIEKKFSIRLNIVSGGNSSSVYLIPKGELPAKINNLRLGESFILGNETAYSQRIPGTCNDAVTLRAQIIELKHKPSLPIGDVGVDAFGQVPSYEDRGWIDRAIFAVGKQDMNPDGLTPLNTKADVLGASSDHLIMDVTKENYKLGDTVDFSLDYGALLKLFTSAYIDREYI